MHTLEQTHLTTKPVLTFIQVYVILPIHETVFFLTLAWLKLNCGRRAPNRSSWSDATRLPNVCKTSHKISRHTHLISVFIPWKSTGKVSISRNKTRKKFQYSRWRTSFCPILLKANVHWHVLITETQTFFLKVKHDYAAKWFIPKFCQTLTVKKQKIGDMIKHFPYALDKFLLLNICTEMNMGEDS